MLASVDGMVGNYEFDVDADAVSNEPQVLSMRYSVLCRSNAVGLALPGVFIAPP